MGIKIIYSNRKAYHEYQIGEKFEAGISLRGTEVKALREGKVNLSEGWIDLTSKNELVLMQAHIGHYTFGNIHNHIETRPRKLLMHKKEIIKLTHQVFAKGVALVPLKLYFKGQFIKLEFGLGKGKKQHDKRESSKKKDADRDIARAMRDR
jgi:SsrA-binding protein